MISLAEGTQGSGPHYIVAPWLGSSTGDSTGSLPWTIHWSDLARLDALFHQNRSTPDHALTPEEQSAQICWLKRRDRKRSSPRELSRFGWNDAPRRPGFRAVRPR